MDRGVIWLENKEKVIIITMEEYKELLMIKGKYEELKSHQILKQNYSLTRDLTEKYKIPKPSYKLTCED